MSEGIYMMRRMAAVTLCIALVTIIGLGCFGGSDDPTDTTSGGLPTTIATTATSVLVTTTEASTLIDGLPRSYVESFGTRPIVVLFYSPGGIEDEKVLAAVRELQGTYSNYTFLTFDYRLPAAYGDLSDELGVNGLPQIVLIDRNGTTRRIWRGYVDKVTFSQTLVTLGRY